MLVFRLTNLETGRVTVDNNVERGVTVAGEDGVVRWIAVDEWVGLSAVGKSAAGHWGHSVRELPD